MDYRSIVCLWSFCFIAFVLAQSEKKKTCVQNLVINGTNLLTAHRKQLLVIGIVNFAEQAARHQANKYMELYRELDRHDIRESVVRLILINEQKAAAHFMNQNFGKIRLFQDNSKDQLIKKLGQNGKTMTNLVFGRCGYLIYTQQPPHSNLLQDNHYQELLRVIMTAVKNKRRCQGLCS